MDPTPSPPVPSIFIEANLKRISYVDFAYPLRYRKPASWGYGILSAKTLRLGCAVPQNRPETNERHSIDPKAQGKCTGLLLGKFKIHGHVFVLHGLWSLYTSASVRLLRRFLGPRLQLPRALRRFLTEGPAGGQRMTAPGETLAGRIGGSFGFLGRVFGAARVVPNRVLG